jgi:hypothetical protein
MNRISNMILAVLLLMLLFLPILIISLLVYFSSGRPVLYWSNRIGKERLIFSMPKFRTMLTNTPETATHMLDNPDVFLTPIGRLLRKTSLDELPQIWSIIVGDMNKAGRGPTKFISPTMILHICGSSSRLVFLNSLPIGVRNTSGLSSICVAVSGVFVSMVLNLGIEKINLSFPIRLDQ